MLFHSVCLTYCLRCSSLSCLQPLPHASPRFQLFGLLLPLEPLYIIWTFRRAVCDNRTPPLCACIITSISQHANTPSLAEHPTATRPKRWAYPNGKQSQSLPCLRTDMDRDGLSQRSAGAGKATTGQRRSSSYHPPTSSTHSCSTSYSHTEQHQRSMTQVLFDTSTPLAWHSGAAGRDQYLAHGSDSIPRSALEDSSLASREHSGSSILRNSHSLRNLNIDVPLDAQSSPSIDGKYTTWHVTQHELSPQCSF
jgi:hypothetical protein